MARVLLVTTLCASYITLYSSLGAESASSTMLATPAQLEQETEREAKKRQKNEEGLRELPLLDPIFSSQVEGRQSRAFDVDLEGAWPEPLQRARIKQATSRELQR